MKRKGLLRRSNLGVLMGLLALLLTGYPVGAQAQADSSAPARAGSLTNRAEVESFVDDFLAEKMTELDVPGVAIVMVKDGEIFLAKGYGYADQERKVPFDPERSIVRAGSIVKTVTATAVMQLAEEGKIDLDADINQYLSSFQVPDTFSQPITARQLLHYTAGLDSKFIGIRVPDETELMPLRDYLAHNLPPRVRPPGQIRAYNDIEIALAGLLVEEVTGMTYAQYVRQNIFQPLEMDSSSMIVPEGQLDRVAIGYSAGGPYPLNYYYLNDAPGAGFNTTAMDLAHFMIMHLQDGAYQGRQVLAAETVQEMHRTGFTHHPRLPGIAYTFDEKFWGERRYLAKAGGAPGFHSRMILVPDDGLGVYTVYNRSHTVPLGWQLENALLERLYPVPEQAVELQAPSPTPSDQASRYAGHYRELIDYSDRGLEKVQALMNDVQVSANDDGSLNLFGSRMMEVGPNLYRATDDGDYVAFAQDSEGRVTYLFAYRTAFARIPWYETTPVQVGLLGLAVAVFLSGAIAWFVALFKHRAAGRWVSGLVSTLNLVFLVGFGILFMPVFASPDPAWQFTFAPPLALWILLAVPLLTSGLVGILLVTNLLSWWNRRGTTLMRVHNTLVLMGGMAFIFFLDTWNLLGFRF
jgi:CubicO group peptidase (beta-lactamase class C family)